MGRTQLTQQAVRISLMGLLCSPGIWLAEDTIAPVAVHAYVSRTNVVLNVQSGEAYTTFLSRAETVARAAIQRNFDQDILISEVYVVIVGQRLGLNAPVLAVQVSRNQWRARPDSRRWATYFPTARVLLGFDSQPTKPTVLPPGVTTPPSASPASPQPPLINAPNTPEPLSPLEQLLPQPEPPTQTTPTPQAQPTTPLPPVSPNQ